MNVGLTHMTAIQMRHVRTVLAASVVRVTMASQELAPTAAVSETIFFCNLMLSGMRTLLEVFALAPKLMMIRR